MDDLGDDDKSVHPSREPVQPPGATILKFPSGKQSDEDNAGISNRMPRNMSFFSSPKRIVTNYYY